MPLVLTDHQLATVKTFAATIPPDKRSVFLERVAAMLDMRRPFTDADVVDVAQLALCGLIHHTDAA